LAQPVASNIELHHYLISFEACSQSLAPFGHELAFANVQFRHRPHILDGISDSGWAYVWKIEKSSVIVCCSYKQNKKLYLLEWL
jgi:hypothetical protein